MQDINVSVTSLSEFVSRTGDLSSGSFGGVSGIEGTRLHQKIFSDLKKQYNEEIITEKKLTGVYSSGDIRLTVGGRLDALIVASNDIPHIIEIKSFNSAKRSYDKLARPEHESQLAIYAALYMEENHLEKIRISLRYVSITTLEAFENTTEITAKDANAIYFDHCTQYIDFAAKLLDYNKSMIESVRELKFPYPEIRNGQARLMKQTLSSLTCKEALFALAPTGTGKTISTLYPAVKGILRGRYDKIFYLTAKTATRTVAVKAMNDMRRSGLMMRSILLASKESMCPYRKKCDARDCKYSEGYYGRVRPALNEILMHDEITPELCYQLATKHNLCPHEFQLDTMNYCNVVIGDYNHAFDPRVSLVRCFDDDVVSTRNVLLIDEAHNLVGRSREMYSASFSHELLRRTAKVFKGYMPKFESYLQRIDQYFRAADHCFAIKKSAFAANEGADESRVLMSTDFEATREIPKELYNLMWRSIRILQDALENLPKGDLRETGMEYFFEVRFFLSVIENYFNESYIATMQKHNGELTVTLTCLDASDKIDKMIRDKMAAVFFSATLSPYEYYRNVLIGKSTDYSRSIELPSPFPSENLDILIDTSISTAYKEREFTADRLVGRIMKELQNRTGNYMIFFPSFEYLNKIITKLEKVFLKLSEEDGIQRKIIKQFPEMNASDKETFLHCFSEAYDGCLIGAAVLGGHFGEGIDLVGDKLSGVVIVGVGIPKITPEREILSNYYSEKFGDGYAFAYRYPGWEKVLQAVGRVIRSEEDTGFALLIDERLDKPEYLTLFPENWNI